MLEGLKSIADKSPLNNINYSSVKVSLLEKPFAWGTNKSVQCNIDRTAPLKQFSLAVHSLLLPNEVCLTC